MWSARHIGPAHPDQRTDHKFPPPLRPFMMVAFLIGSIWEQQSFLTSLATHPVPGIGVLGNVRRDGAGCDHLVAGTACPISGPSQPPAPPASTAATAAARSIRALCYTSGKTSALNFHMPARTSSARTSKSKIHAADSHLAQRPDVGGDDCRRTGKQAVFAVTGLWWRGLAEHRAAQAQADRLWIAPRLSGHLAQAIHLGPETRQAI